MKRLIVYFHYDPLGQIDTACRVAVEAMAHYGEVFFISNGTLRPADRAWAASMSSMRTSNFSLITVFTESLI